MNFRAQLYDAWRQLRVTANALMGVLNVTVTNQYLTPPTTNNPFAFLDQAKQFSLVLNAELPLVRINERNQFRTALINYQRQRRTLQFQEDFQKLQLRNDIRSLQVTYLSYQLNKRNFVLYARQKDQAFENIVQPPQGGGGGTTATTGAGNAGTNASAAVQTQNLTQAQNSLIGLENTLVTTWYSYQGARMTLYRDLGTLPYDEWEAFYELFPSEYRGVGAGGRGYASAIDAPTPSDLPGGRRAYGDGEPAAGAPPAPAAVRP
jgi:K+-sensing histidine kinase KdpD